MLKYAQNAGLKYASLVIRDGYTVLPTVEGVQQAESNTPATPGTYLKPSIANAPGEHSYPIAGFTYLLVYRGLSYMKVAEAKALIDFLKWLLGDGQQESPNCTIRHCRKR